MMMTIFPTCAICDDGWFDLLSLVTHTRIIYYMYEIVPLMCLHSGGGLSVRRRAFVCVRTSELYSELCARG